MVMFDDVDVYACIINLIIKTATINIHVMLMMLCYATCYGYGVLLAVSIRVVPTWVSLGITTFL